MMMLASVAYFYHDDRASYAVVAFELIFLGIVSFYTRIECCITIRHGSESA